MTCKQCGTDEDRLKGFCSIECRDKFDYEEEIRELKKALSAIIEITHNNYDHDTQRIYKIAKEVIG